MLVGFFVGFILVLFALVSVLLEFVGCVDGFLAVFFKE